MQSIKTDLSCANLGELETISRDAQLRHYVKHMVFTGFDECLENLGEGYKWGSHRHQSGHLINLQEHPAVKKLSNILCQLANCKSFEIYAVFIRIRDQSDYENFRSTDSITTLMDVVARAHLPVTALTVNFMDHFNSAPNPQRLQVSDKEQFIAMGNHLEELKLMYEIDDDIVHDWTFNLLLCTPKLRILHLKGLGLSVRELFHCLALSVAPWPQLQELYVKCIATSTENLMILLQGCQNSLRVLHLDVVRMIANVADIKQMLRTLSTSFPVLESVSFDCIRLGVTMRRDYFIYFPVPVENPFVDEEQGKFEFGTKNTRGWPRVSRVAYSGPKMDVALDILARTVDGAPSIWRPY